MQTYIVRIWVPADGATGAVLRGVAERVASGEATVFVGSDQLLAFLSSHERGPGRGFAEGRRRW